MEHSQLIERIQRDLFSPSADLFALLPVSAYETAWVAMVPDSDDPTNPMFPECLDWILRSQNALGFWFDDHVHEKCNLDIDHRELINDKHHWSGADLMATLACLIALKTWEIDSFSHEINKGLKFLRDNMEKELMMTRKSEEGGEDFKLLYRWFLMAELAKAKGLNVFPAAQLIKNQLFNEFKLNGTNSKSREEDKTMERIVMREIAFENSSSELFRSPSVTACAFMISGDPTYKAYLQNLLVDCQPGVPPIYLENKDVIKLWVVDHLERLGCAELFTEDIMHVMDHQYGKWITEELQVPKKEDAAFQIYKDSLAFRLLRMHGYQVSPRRFCWFIDDKEMQSHIKDNYAFFIGPMLSIYKASHIAFPEDNELDKAAVFARHILQMGILSTKSQNETKISATSAIFEQEIEHELGLKWLARMDHLEHRFYIERGGLYFFWIGKNSPYCKILQNGDLLQLAIENFMTRQLVYKKELDELHRWAKNTGLSTMGFGREKTSYIYFAVASSTCIPLTYTDSRKEAVKSAILITVADDFFDEKASLHELSVLTDAIQRWEGTYLTSHNKVIFTSLDNLVHDISLKILERHGHDLKKNLQDVWKEIFKSWLKEAEWTRNTYYPSIDQYIENGKISIAVHMMILIACYLINSKIDVEESCWDLSNTMTTQSLMISCRLLNELESYEKEVKDGKPNLLLLYQKVNPKRGIDDAIAFVRKILENKKKELLQLVMLKDSTRSAMPREWKDMHLCYLKVFQMFFNSANAFDSPTMLLESIKKAIYEPLDRKNISQHAQFISKKSKIINILEPYTRVKIGSARNKRKQSTFNSNKWLDQWTNKKFNHLSFTHPFIACNTTAKVCFESISFSSRF